METTDHIDLDRAQALAGLLDLDPDQLRGGDLLRPMWHLGYLLARTSQSQLGSDGHPRSDRGPHARRMFAGGRIELRPGLRIGEEVSARTETIGERVRSGRAGDLAFVTTRTTVRSGGTSHLTDERDVVYLDTLGSNSPLAMSAPNSSNEDPETTARSTVEVDPILLFRFSALTYNAHRIHYDAPYARDVEGYPGLVVHGPLQALLMAEAATTAAVGPLGTPLPGTVEFNYRLVAPLFAGQGLAVSCDEDGSGVVSTRVSDRSGRITAHGTLRVRANVQRSM